MSDIGRMALFRKLNPFLYKTLEEATRFCRSRGKTCVELAHWLNQMLQQANSDLHRILLRFNILSRTLLPRISREILQAMIDGAALAAIEVSVAGGESVYRFEREDTACRASSH